jgi:hypothetical protein
MSTSWSIHRRTSSGVHFSRSPIEAVCVAEEQQIQYRKSTMSMNKCIHSANTNEKVNYAPVRKAVRINPAAPHMTAVNLQETLRQVTSSTLRQQALKNSQNDYGPHRMSDRHS